MKSRTALILTVGLAGAFHSAALPPAPPHEIYGLVRDEGGEPITDDTVEMVFETDVGFLVNGAVALGVQPGVNYYITVPMDAGLTPVPYVESAQQPLVPFKISVVISGVTNLPIEMTGGYANLGLSGESTRIDLTLGVDSDGDGLPDAWEELLIFLLDDVSSLADVDPDDDLDGDGMTNLDEYYSGTYAFDDGDLFELYPREGDTNNARFAFLAIQGYSYEIQASTNLTEWVEVSFAVLSEPGFEGVDFYSPGSSGIAEVEISATNVAAFYRGRVR